MTLLAGSGALLAFLWGMAEAKRALIVVDMQVDFISGSLSVPEAEDIIDNVNNLINLNWDVVVFTEDYHPHDHISFASQNPGQAEYSTKELKYNSAGQVCKASVEADQYGMSAAECAENEVAATFQQELWPDHCVQDTPGQKMDSRVRLPQNAAVIKKGLTTVIDSYGALLNNFEDTIGYDKLTPRERLTFTENGVDGWLLEAGITEVYIAGLALDFCVKYTAEQAKVLGYTPVVIQDATKAVFKQNEASVVQGLADKGIAVKNTSDVIDVFRTKQALLVVDMQNDFITGSLAVTDAADIVANVNALTELKNWDTIIFTEDYHPHDSISFASSHAQPEFSLFELKYNGQGQVCDMGVQYGNSSTACTPEDVKVTLNQSMWPDHCVQNTEGQKTAMEVNIPEGTIAIKKGMTTVIDSYGAYGNNYEHAVGYGVMSPRQMLTFTENGLEEWMDNVNIREVYIAGLALDFCVKYSALQATKRGYKVNVISDASKPVFPANGDAVVEELEGKGVTIMQTANVVANLAATTPPKSLPTPISTPPSNVCPATTTTTTAAPASGLAWWWCIVAALLGAFVVVAIGLALGLSGSDADEKSGATTDV